MAKPTVEELIAQLVLVKHPEGGWYRETHRSEEVIQGAVLPDRFTSDRSVSTAIYFLLQSGDISALHRIKSDEIWHFYSGVPLTVHVITPRGEYYPLNLGSSITAGETFQCVVPEGCWFGAEVSRDGYALVGCTVAPGFDFADFEMGSREICRSNFLNRRKLSSDWPRVLMKYFSRRHHDRTITQTPQHTEIHCRKNCLRNR